MDFVRNDLSTHADGLPHGIGKLVGRGLDDLPKDLVGESRIVAQRLGDLAQILIQGDRIRLAIVPRLDRGERLAMLFDQLAQPAEQLAAVRRGEFSPGGIIQGLASRLDGRIHVRSRCGVDRCDFGFVAGDFSLVPM